MVGKTAVFTSNQVSLTQGQPATIGFTLSQPAANVKIVLQDESGQNVRTIALTSPNDLKNSISWDGRDDNNDELPTGTYTAQIQATDLQGNTISATQNISARITGITFSNGTTTLLAGSTSLQLSDITELDE
jgi:flagellar basal-body rod modification protein FlgD